MSSGPENTFRRSIHDKLGEGVYHFKSHNPYTGGVPDDWYSGIKSDLWVEYKYIKALPKRVAVVPNLAPLQKEWLRGRYDEGRRVYVIVGSPKGGMIFANPDEWENGILSPVVRSRQWIAEWISVYTSGIYATKAKTGGCRSRKRITLQDSVDGSSIV